MTQQTTAGPLCRRTTPGSVVRFEERELSFPPARGQPNQTIASDVTKWRSSPEARLASFVPKDPYAAGCVVEVTD
jgi:hypothetical protein